MEGILLIDKPEGWTSFDVVNYARKTVARLEGKKPKHVKVGHTGTLDPSATGLLVLCIGKATKQVPTMIKHNKKYEVELTLGKTSTTGDKEGEILDRVLKNEERREPTPQEVERAIKLFVGEIEQVPPAYSAIKINGKRAYDLAREGKTFELKARKVTIHSITGIKYKYPEVTFTTLVGSGTYIRSLATDIGEKLGCGAYMSNLRRVTVGEYDISQAYALSELDDSIEQKLLAC